MGGKLTFGSVMLTSISAIGDFGARGDLLMAAGMISSLKIIEVYCCVSTSNAGDQ